MAPPTASQSLCQQEMAVIDSRLLPLIVTRCSCSFVPFQSPMTIAAGRMRLSAPAISHDLMLAHDIGPRVVLAGTGTSARSPGGPLS